jgi:hypothetical protein
MVKGPDPFFGQCRRRRGLAPVELVLWLPVLLFVVALLINYGTMATWRIRGEVVSHDAAFRARWGRTGSGEGRLVGQWPATAALTTVADPPVTQIDDPFIQHPVVRGPLPNGFVVRPVLDPDEIGAYRGSAAVERMFPLMPSLGHYESGEIAGSLLDRKWTGPEMRIPNIHRRIPVLYELPKTDPQLPKAFREAVLALLGIPHFPALDVLDHDEDMRLITGRYPDFHPRVRRMCELDRDVVWRQQVERLIDIRNALGEIRLGEISRLPRTMTEYFLQVYRAYVQSLQQQIDALEAELAGPPPPSPQRAQQIQQQIQALQDEIDRIQPKIDQLEDYHARLPDIEDALRQSADAVIP